MTIEEALKIIKQSEKCHIVWRTDTGEIVKVENLGKIFSPEDHFESLSNLTVNKNIEESDESIQYASQFRSSEMIDTDYLEKQRNDFQEMNLRVKVLNQWTEQPVNETITILETNSFPFPTTASDTYILLERLFDFKWQEIGEPELERLWRLIKTETLAEKNKILLEFHLLFFEWKKDEFVELYKGVFFMNPFLYISRYVDYYVGDLQIANEFVLKNYHELLKNSRVLFGTKYPAMIALGKIGSKSGEKSAQIIEENIYDSEEYIIKARDLVLKRIRSSDESWQRCDNCRFGRIKGNYGNMLTMNDCPICAGLGWIEV